MKKTLLPVDVCRSKTPLLKLPFNRKYDQQQMEKNIISVERTPIPQMKNLIK